MYDRHKLTYPNENQRLKQTTFFDLVKILTQTQEKSLRALDYNITNLVHEAHSRLLNIVLHLYDDNNNDCK